MEERRCSAYYRSMCNADGPVSCLRIWPTSFELTLELCRVMFGVDVRMLGCLRNFVSLNSLVRSDQASLPRSLGGRARRPAMSMQNRSVLIFDFVLWLGEENRRNNARWHWDRIKRNGNYALVLDCARGKYIYSCLYPLELKLIVFFSQPFLSFLLSLRVETLKRRSPRDSFASLMSSPIDYIVVTDIHSLLLTLRFRRCRLRVRLIGVMFQSARRPMFFRALATRSGGCMLKRRNSMFISRIFPNPIDLFRRLRWGCHRGVRRFLLTVRLSFILFQRWSTVIGILIGLRTFNGLQGCSVIVAFDVGFVERIFGRWSTDIVNGLRARIDRQRRSLMLNGDGRMNVDDGLMLRWRGHTFERIGWFNANMMTVRIHFT